MLAALFFAAELRTLTLAEAEATAMAHQPQLRQARAATAAARARADQARAPLLPQLNVTASYQLTTANFVARPGFVSGLGASGGSGGGATGITGGPLFNFFSFGGTLSQYLWDFGVTTGRWRAFLATAEGQRFTEQATRLTTRLQVQVAFFAARAQRALLGVARENLANQERHLTQVAGYVRVGARPEIDLSQARADRATANVQVINAENNYQVARVQLTQAMGIDGVIDFEVGDEALPELPGEAAEPGPLWDEALRARPELRNADQQVIAQERTLAAARGGYGPALSLAMAATAQGIEFTSLTPNWNLSVNLAWNLFGGLITRSQIREAQANLEIVNAQRDTLRQQLRVEVEQARLGVRAARGALGAAREALTAARERLRLAEGRYQAGVGNIIELGDAQVAQTSAAAQAVQAEYNLATARAQLGRALGRG